jgi:hypothetical protein
MLGGKFGAYVLAAGAAGELLPTIAISVFLTQHDHFAALASVALVGLLALGLSFLPRVTRYRRLRGIISEGQDSTGQTTLRWTTVLLFLLLTIASRFGLDVTLDLKAISHDPLRVVFFFLLLLVVRGLPSLLIYRRVLSLRHRAQMTFITATTMPLLIALAEIGKRDGVMLPATSAALVGAGVLSVLVYPPIAVALGRGDRSREQAGADVADQEGGELAASG